MILTARRYFDDLLKEIGIKHVYTTLAAARRMKPILWAMIDNPDPEEYTPNYYRMYTDREGIRTYHIKDYDATLILSVRIGAQKDETANHYKRTLLQRLARMIEDPDGYQIAVSPVHSDLNPEEYELPESPEIIIRIRFAGGLWRQEAAQLIQEVVPMGEIVKNPKELEE